MQNPDQGEAPMMMTTALGPPPAPCPHGLTWCDDCGTVPDLDPPEGFGYTDEEAEHDAEFPSDIEWLRSIDGVGGPLDEVQYAVEGAEID